MNTGNEPSTETLRDYEQLVTECLADNTTETMHVTRVVSATERGTTLRLENSTAAFAFKFVQIPDDIPTDTRIDFAYLRAMIENEAVLLKQIPEPTHRLLVADGTSAARAWVMTRWLPGPSVARLARQFRQRLQKTDGEESQAIHRDLLSLITDVFGTVADLHDLGYTHGDIQPAHFIYETADKTAQDGSMPSLIDFGLARRQGQAGIPYRGALVHFVAPEIAAGMREGSDDIAYDKLAEVYSVASAAFQLYTGKTSTDYGNEAPGSVSFREILTRISDGGMSTRRTLASAGAPPFPALEAILEQCLLPDRKDRGSSLRIASQELQSIVADSR